MVSKWNRQSRNRAKGKAKVRQAVLKRDIICQCEGCDRCYPAEGPCLRDATEADHLRPVSEAGEAEDLADLSGKCSPCHLLKSQQEALRGIQRRSSRWRFDSGLHPGLL